MDLMLKEFLMSNLMAVGQGYRKEHSVSKLYVSLELTCESGAIRLVTNRHRRATKGFCWTGEGDHRCDKDFVLLRGHALQ